MGKDPARRRGHVPSPRRDGERPDRDDTALLERLRAGDADAFAWLVDAWSPGMLRVARLHVSTHASAEEVVQDAWLAVIRGLDRFEQRSSLRTWVLRIVANLAKTRGVREARTVPWSSLAPVDEVGPTVDPARFRPPGEKWAHGWTESGVPAPWPTPEDSLLAGEAFQRLREAFDALPPRQRAVVALRDVDGLGADEACAALDLTPANQRVLLHRGRARLRAALEDYHREAAGVGA